jgi:hypothetical protein
MIGAHVCSTFRGLCKAKESQGWAATCLIVVNASIALFSLGSSYDFCIREQIKGRPVKLTILLNK